MIAFEISLKSIACIALVDFLSGFFHWLEDAYGHPDWPITGWWITRPNILHHHDARHFTQHSWLHSADVLLVMGGLTLVVSYWLGWLNWMTWLVVLVGVNANEFHNGRIEARPRMASSSPSCKGCGSSRRRRIMPSITGMKRIRTIAW